MLYIQSLLDEWQFPPTDKAVRAKWETELAKRGVASLHNELAQKDPVAAETILPTDPRRTVRALEVIELTGKPYAASKPQHNPIPKWGTKIIGLKASTEWLDPRLLKRTQKMFEEGLIEETKLLCSNGLKEGVTASRAIGYQQAIAVIDGEISIEQAIEDTFIATRQYVRRQRSWFKRDDRIDWFIASTSSFPDEVLQALAEH